MGETIKFNYDGEDYEFQSQSDLYNEFLLNFEYSNVCIDENFIYIDLENGNEIKIKLL